MTTSAISNGPPSRVTFVLWDGTLGGAESLSLELVRRLRELGHDGTLAFIKNPEPLIGRADEQLVPTVQLRFRRGLDVVRHCREYASAIGETRPDLVIAMSVNHLAWGLRAGGYTGPLIATEHGELLRHEAGDWVERSLTRGNRLIASRLINAEVTVSDFMRTQVRRVPHSKHLTIVSNGVDTERFRPDPDEKMVLPLVFGFAGRLIPGKGVEHLIDAVSRLACRADVKLRIAGDGPMRANLESMAAASSATAAIEFLGNVMDMPRFWRSVHVGLAPSSTFGESFGMSPLEAMACGRSVVVTHNGGLVDLVTDGVTGRVVAPGDTDALENALAEHLDLATTVARGRAAREAAVEKFSLDACLAGYLRLAGLRSPSH